MQQRKQFEYIKVYWNHTCQEDPIVLFYEVDPEQERYATRLTEIFRDRRAIPVVEPGFAFITEAPVPPVEEINQKENRDDFYAEIISKEEFEAVYGSAIYQGDIRFPAPDV